VTAETPITGYTVTPYIGAVAQTPSVFASTATAESIGGLTNGTAYTFTVSATNVVGNSPPSTPSAAVTPATVPTAPTALSGASGNGSVTLSWSAPSNDGGNPISGYTVTPYIGAVAQTPSVFASVATTETINGPDQRHRLHLHRQRHQLGGQQPPEHPFGGRHPGHRAHRPDGAQRSVGERLGHLVVECAVQRRREPDQRLHRHPLHRCRGPDPERVRLGGHRREHHGPDQRHRLHLHRQRHQRGGQQPPEHPFGGRHPGHRAQCPDGAQRSVGERVGHLVVEAPSSTAGTRSAATPSPPTSVPWPRPRACSPRWPPPRASRA
jgi:hypothetical protein